VLPRDQPLDKGFLQTYCSNILTAVDLICEWLEEKPGR
jgi:hypothetical protein